MSVSLAAFAFLQCHSWVEAVKASEEEAVATSESIQDKRQHSEDTGLGDRAGGDAEEDTLLSRSSCGSCPSSTSATTVTISSPRSGDATSGLEEFRQVWQLLACQWVLAAFSFGWLPSTMPYVYKKFAVRSCDAFVAGLILMCII
jgi:riboflavin transporter 2